MTTKPLWYCEWCQSTRMGESRSGK